jgi:hypothetical protein
MGFADFTSTKQPHACGDYGDRQKRAMLRDMEKWKLEDRGANGYKD